MKLKEYNSEVIFIADNHLLTGGCRYVNECENFTNNCKNCLALKKFQKISVDIILILEIT